MDHRAPVRVRIPRVLLRDGGPELAGYLAAELGDLIASALASARGRKTAAVELAEALRLHADDPGLARAAAKLREFAQPYRVAGTGLIDAFATLAARGMATEPDREHRLTALRRLIDWCWQTASATVAAEARELIVAERRRDGGPELLYELRALVREISFDGKSTRDVAPLVAEMLDLSTRLSTEGRMEAADLVCVNRTALKACEHLQGPRAALDASARFVELAGEWCPPDDPAHLPLVEKALDEHISRLLALDRLDEAIDHSRRLVDRYLLLVTTSRDVNLGDAAIAVDRHAHLLDRAERSEEAVEASARAIALGEEAEDFPRQAGLLRFHADRLLVVGRESEAIEVAVRAVEAGERAGSPLETAFSLGDLVVKLLEAERPDEALDWSRRSLAAWSELVDGGVEIAPRNLAIALTNHEAARLAKEAGR